MQTLWYVVEIVVAVGILWKCADWFVEGAVGVAEKMNVPQMLVGMVLVSIATTSPELMSSLMAAMQGNPEMALGNAVGSVVVDASLALGLAALVSSVPLRADPGIFRSSAVVLIVVIILAFLMTLDGTLMWYEGAVLLAIYITYTAFSYWQVQRRKKLGDPNVHIDTEEELEEIEKHIAAMSTQKIVGLFVIGFAGVIFGSHLLVNGASGLAVAFNLSGVIVGIVLVALGTSTPEIATCVASALKKQSGIGVGNIIGADILNICWVAGISSLANPLTAELGEVYYMFPGMFAVVIIMLGMLRRGYQLNRFNGGVLVTLYVLYMLGLFVFVTSPSELPVH